LPPDRIVIFGELFVPKVNEWFDIAVKFKPPVSIAKYPLVVSEKPESHKLEPDDGELTSNPL